MLTGEWRIKQKEVEKQFEQLRDQLPLQIQEELPELFNNWRLKYFFLGMDPTYRDILILKKLKEKLKEVKK